MAKTFFSSIKSDERIVRVIYSEHNINPKTKVLKANFFKFDLNLNTDKKELSCIRFELEDMIFCREFGRQNENPAYKRNYYGLACTTPFSVCQLPDYQFCFTPDLEHSLKNYFHTDLYDNYNYNVVPGQASPAQLNYRTDELKKQWKINSDIDDSLRHDNVLPN